MLDPQLATFVASFEGFRPDAYLDAGGVWTIGFGETGPHVDKNSRISREEGEMFLQRSLQKANDCVRRFVEIPLSEGQEAALTSLVFNIGCGAFRKSSLLRFLNAGDINRASLEFPRWSRAAGKILPGLVRRRAAEQHLFTDGW